MQEYSDDIISMGWFFTVFFDFQAETRAVEDVSAVSTAVLHVSAVSTAVSHVSAYH
jgi:hypothetical protein